MSKCETCGKETTVRGNAIKQAALLLSKDTEFVEKMAIFINATIYDTMSIAIKKKPLEESDEGLWKHCGTKDIHVRERRRNYAREEAKAAIRKAAGIEETEKRGGNQHD